MKRAVAILALAGTALAAQAAEAGRGELVLYTDHLRPSVAAEVERHAAQGMKALARYMERTRIIHGLWFDDVLRERDEREPIARKVAQREFRKHATEWR